MKKQVFLDVEAVAPCPHPQTHTPSPPSILVSVLLSVLTFCKVSLETEVKKIVSWPSIFLSQWKHLKASFSPLHSSIISLPPFTKQMLKHVNLKTVLHFCFWNNWMMQPWMLFTKKSNVGFSFLFSFCFPMVIRSLPVDNISSWWQKSMVEWYSGSLPLSLELWIIIKSVVKWSSPKIQ